MLVYKDNGFPNSYRNTYFEVTGDAYTSESDGQTYYPILLHGFKQYTKDTHELLHDTHTKCTPTKGGLHEVAVKAATGEK